MTLLSISGTPLVVLLLGVTLLVGFGADWLAHRFRVPDVLWLIALGIVVGPLLGLLSPSPFLALAPTLGVATLILILFDAGLDLKLSVVRPLAGPAVAFAVASYLGSTALLFVVGDLFLFPGATVLSLLFGTALGCTSGAIVIPIAARVGLPPGLRGVVQLEAAIEDALAVVAVTTVLALLAAPHGSVALSLTAALLLPFPVGIALGLVAGLLCLFFLYDWQERPFAALATLGFVFVLYAGAEALGGSGILAALVMGAVLANAEAFRPILRQRRPFHVAAELRKVEVEIAFVLRAFFLFLVGLFVSLSNPGLWAGLAIVGLVVGLFALRLGAARAATGGPSLPKEWAAPLAGLCGRGLTSAVLLLVALEKVPGVQRLLLPALLVIVGTNVGMTVGLWARAPPAPPEPAIAETERRWAAVAAQLVTLDADDRPPLPGGGLRIPEPERDGPPRARPQA